MTTQALEASPQRSAGAHRPGRRSPPRHVFGVLGIAVLTFAAHLTLVVQNWRLGNYRAFDSVIFDQAVAAYSRFELPRVPLKGVYAGNGRDFLQLGDHFPPSTPRSPRCTGSTTTCARSSSPRPRCTP